jgi:hypothetical protein
MVKEKMENIISDLNFTLPVKLFSGKRFGSLKEIEEKNFLEGSLLENLVDLN